MPLVCRECAKRITGSVAEHYRTCHWSTFVANGEQKFLDHPRVFQMESQSSDAAETRVNIARKKQAKVMSRASGSVVSDKHYKTRQKAIISFIDAGCDVQTHRGGEFVCEICQQKKASGKRLLTYGRGYSVCYSCYSTLKKAHPGKRGNKHFFINTPM